MSVHLKAAFFFACLASVLPSAVAAQTSSAVIVRAAPAAGFTPATPATPLDIPDAAYPLQSLLANQEGRIGLNLHIDTAGRVTLAQIVSSTGFGILDGNALRVARAWSFKPATQGGMPIATELRVDVNWKLPLRPADDYVSQMMGIPAAGKVIAPPQPIAETHRLSSGDYPYESLGKFEQGEVALRVLVLEDGTVGQIETIESSGFPQLDRSATTAVKRFTYRPGVVDGAPTKMWNDIKVAYVLVRGLGPLPSVPKFCHARPLLGSSIGMASNGNAANVRISQWIHVLGNGSVDDVLLRTDHGWMHLSDPLVSAISVAAGNGGANLTSRKEIITGGLMSRNTRRGRTASCWYEGDVTAGAN